MIKKLQDMREAVKEESIPVRAWFAGTLFALGFWGIAFPQYLFTDDCVKVFCADGREAEEEEREDENLYRGICTAKPEQIEVKISILEWAKRGREGKEQ